MAGSHLGEGVNAKLRYGQAPPLDVDTNFYKSNQA
jgi:hypothetical protein